MDSINIAHDMRSSMQLQSRYKFSSNKAVINPAGTDVRFRKLDLNLLVALDSLLSEANVTRAAKHMHITQSAMSAALGRLREHFGDALLIPSGRGMQRTRLAEDLMAPLADLVAQIDAFVSNDRQFDPAIATDRFVIVFASSHISDIGASVIDEVLKLAPNVQVDLRTSIQTAAEALTDLDVDLVCAPEQIRSVDQPSAVISVKKHVAVCSTQADFCADGKPLDFAAFTAARHVAFGGSASPLMGALNEATKTTSNRFRVDANTGLVSVIGQLLNNPERIALLPSNVADIVLSNGGTRVVPLAFAVEDYRCVLQWRERDQSDPAVAWFKGIVHACAASANQRDASD